MFHLLFSVFLLVLYHDYQEDCIPMLFPSVPASQWTKNGQKETKRTRPFGNWKDKSVYQRQLVVARVGNRPAEETAVGGEKKYQATTATKKKRRKEAKAMKDDARLVSSRSRSLIRLLIDGR